MRKGKWEKKIGKNSLLPVLSDEALDFANRDAVFDACKAKFMSPSFTVSSTPTTLNIAAPVSAVPL